MQSIVFLQVKTFFFEQLFKYPKNTGRKKGYGVSFAGLLVSALHLSRVIIISNAKDLSNPSCGGFFLVYFFSSGKSVLEQLPFGHIAR